jgi:hypothetical protein
MRPSPPRHLAQRSSRLDLARNRHLVLQSSSLLAVVLLVTVILANLPGGPGSGAASGGPSGGPSGVTVGEPLPTATAGSGNPVRNWSFEQDLNGWQVVGPGDASAAPQGRTSGSCASVRARQPGRVGLAQAAVVPGAAAGRRFVAKAWVRSTAPGLKVTLRLVGTGTNPERSQATTTTTAPGLAWRSVIVDHTVTAAGTDLGVEITAGGVPAGEALLVDEVTVRQG